MRQYNFRTIFLEVWLGVLLGVFRVTRQHLHEAGYIGGTFRQSLDLRHKISSNIDDRI